MFNLLFLLIPLFGYSNTLDIGKKIWKNECAGTVEGLVFWNKHEECLSLGIGHFIWYPENSTQKFDAMFPKYLAFLKEKNVSIPKFILSFDFTPWKSREEFLKAEAEIQELRQWLSETVALQAEFMVLRLNQSLDRILKKATPAEQKHLALVIPHLTGTNEGTFALIDYLNFKGDGLNCLERYQGKGWGLYQVLMGMDAPTLEQFKASAIARLKERVAGAPIGKNESRWLTGWINRIQSY
jgi:hypothetical protein